MIPNRLVSLALVANTLAALAVVAGCSDDNPDRRVAAMNDTNIKRLTNLYQEFRLHRNSTGPKDEAELKQFIQQDMPRPNLERMLVDPENVDALFTSERDGQTLVVRYGVQGGLGASDPVVFEREGRGGKRQVGFTNGTVEEVEGARYEQLMQGG